MGQVSKRKCSMHEKSTRREAPCMAPPQPETGKDRVFRLNLDCDTRSTVITTWRPADFFTEAEPMLTITSVTHGYSYEPTESESAKKVVSNH
jgi:hypothetical protein